MPSSYSTNTGLELMETGAYPGQWGTITNRNLTCVDEALNGVKEILLTSPAKLIELIDASPDQEARKKVLHFTGSPSATCTVRFSPTDMQAYYFVINDTDQQLSFVQGSGSPYLLDPYQANVIWIDGKGANAAVLPAFGGLQLTRLLVKPQPNLQPNDADTPVNAKVEIRVPTEIYSTLALTGNFTVQGAMTFTGNMGITGSLTVSANITLQGNFDVTGTSLFRAAVTMNTTLEVLQVATFDQGWWSKLGARIDFGGDSTGDIYYRSAPATNGWMARLGIGTSGQFLRVSGGGTPNWVSPELAINTPVTGGTSPCVLFIWNGLVANSANFIFDNTNLRLGLGVSGPSSVIHVKASGGAFITADADVTTGAGPYRGYRISSNGNQRWELGALLPEANTLPNDGSDFVCHRYLNDLTALRWMYVVRRSGHVTFGKDDVDLGGTLNVRSVGASEPAMVVRGANPGPQTGPLMVFQDSNGNIVTSIGPDGTFTGGMQTLTSLKWTRQASIPAPQLGVGPLQYTNLVEGILHPHTAGGAADPGGYWVLGYSLGPTSAYLECPLPTLSDHPGWDSSHPITGITWVASLGGVSTLSFAELRDLTDSDMIDRILARPALVARIRDAIAVL